MRRLHLLELEDQPWFPALLRRYMTDFLRFAQTVLRVPQHALRHTRLLLAQATTPQLVDLCSGSGGPAIRLAELLRVPVVLTDLFPQASTVAVGDAAALASSVRRRTSPGSPARVHPQAVDARRVPGELGGVRTLFNAFHHFRPEDAHRILAAAVAAGEPIAVFELAARRPLTLALTATVPLVQLATAPLQRPWSWSRLLFTYVVPVLPLLLLFDGLVSCLRAYGPDELAELTADLGGRGWRWEIRRERLSLTPVHLTVLLGHPVIEPAD